MRKIIEVPLHEFIGSNATMTITTPDMPIIRNIVDTEFGLYAIVEVDDGPLRASALIRCFMNDVLFDRGALRYICTISRQANYHFYQGMT